MSLVNDMLKDLENSRREALPAGVSVAHANGKRSLRALLTGAGVLALVATAFFLGVNWQSESRQSIAIDKQALDPSPAAADLLLEEASVREMAAVRVEAEPTPEVVSPATETNASFGAGKIAALLAAADLALQSDRLTSPINDNAFSRYQAILLLEPQHPQALNGIQQIAQRYLDFYQRKLQVGDTRAANFYRDQAEGVVSGYPNLSVWLREALLLAAQQVATAKPEPNVDQAPLVDDKPIATLRKEPSRAEQEKRLLAQAESLMNSDRLAQAYALLSDYLAEYPDADALRKTMFDVLLESGELSAAREQLAQLGKLPDHELAQLEARLSVQAGDLNAAIAAMQKTSPSFQDAPDFYSYLAALYHKSSHYQEAAELYSRLTDMDSSRATYWLGLAVSLDALADRAGALRAFRFAQRLSSPDAPSRAYVEERIRSLSG